MLLIALSVPLLLQAPAGDPGYATDALRELVRAAAETNARVPAGLASYTATAETEVALVGVDQRSHEQTMLLEQIAQSVAWDRTGQLDQWVIGYRSQSSVITTLTALSLASWIVPVLYGNRFGLLFGPAPASRKRKPTDKPPRRVESIHPLSPRRDEIYRFSGGDTIVVIRPGARTIPVVRIRVEPVVAPAVATNVLRGELMVDAASHQLISLRGEILEVGGRGSVGRRLRSGLFTAVGYVDFQSREVDARFWLPGAQRIELQISSSLAGDGRAVWRFQTRFDDIAVATNDSVGATGTGADTLAALPRKLALATEAELASYPAWRWKLGEGTADLRVDDFGDVEQLRIEARGPGPTVEFYARRFDDLFRFNKVEGAFTGVGFRARAANRKDGLAIGGTLGRAWSEEAIRGGGFAEWNAPRWRLSAIGERSLETANRFADSPRRGDWGAALIGSSDDFDYLDRRAFGLKLERDLSLARGRLVAEGGWASDRTARASISRGLFGSDSGFRPNRPIDPGSYGVISVSATLYPDVTGESIRPGWTAGARIEYGTGDLDWTRAEVRAGWRHVRGRLITTGRIDAGLVESDQVPLQQLFAIGGESDALGFEYKEFGGDRAAIGRTSVRYALPFLQRPFHPPFMRSPRSRIPGIAPALAVGVRSVWTDASSRTTLDALSRFGMRSGTGLLATRPTHGAPAAASVGVLLFGGSIFLGWSRRLDSDSPWTFTFARGSAL